MLLDYVTDVTGKQVMVYVNGFAISEVVIPLNSELTIRNWRVAARDNYPNHVMDLFLAKELYELESVDGSESCMI